MDKTTYQNYLSLLKRELIPAMGCTEPIALAYCAASAQQLAEGRRPEELTSLDAIISGNIIKNVKSVVVPNTGGRRGIETAIAAGLLSSGAERKLEVLANLDPKNYDRLQAMLDNGTVKVRPATNDVVLYVELQLHYPGCEIRAILQGSHTGLTLLERNGEVIFSQEAVVEAAAKAESEMTVQSIFDFVNEVDVEDIRPMVGRQLEYNVAIAKEGMKTPWGANVGKVLADSGDKSPRCLARAYAAAGSDARMSGCEMPVVIVSGSGNQGITASVPVWVYAQHLGKSEDELLRAVALADLVTVHQKSGIGSLSAFCGAICAGCGAAAGIAYLETHDYRTIAHTIVNGLAIISGMVCDGAKPSCAGKIAASVEAGLMGYEMIKREQQFRGGDGIVEKGVDNTINNVGRMAKQGMHETDRVILEIMCDC